MESKVVTFGWEKGLCSLKFLKLCMHIKLHIVLPWMVTPLDQLHGSGRIFVSLGGNRVREKIDFWSWLIKGQVMSDFFISKVRKWVVYPIN